MATLLWRVLNSMGYLEGKVPHYYGSKEQLGDQTLVNVEVVILAEGMIPTRVDGSLDSREELNGKVPIGQPW
jgi:hypothetical protein